MRTGIFNHNPQRKLLGSVVHNTLHNFTMCILCQPYIENQCAICCSAKIVTAKTRLYDSQSNKKPRPPCGSA